MDAAFAKLDSNGDGYIDLEELLAQLPFQTAEAYEGERLMEVSCFCTSGVHWGLQNFTEDLQCACQCNHHHQSAVVLGALN